MASSAAAPASSAQARYLAICAEEHMAPHPMVLTQLDAVDAAPATGAVLKVSSTLSWRDAAPLFNALAASTPPPLQVDLSQTQLRDAEVFKTVVSFARSFKLLAHLQLAGCGLTDSHLATLVEALHHGGSAVETLDIGSNGGGAATTAALAAFLVHPACQVTRLALDNNRIGDTNGVLLATEGISSCKSLRTLCLRRCGLGQRAGHALVRALDRNAALLHLHLDYNLLQSALITAIDGRLAANRKGYLYTLYRLATASAVTVVVREPPRSSGECASLPSARRPSLACPLTPQIPASGAGRAIDFGGSGAAPSSPTAVARLFPTAAGTLAVLQGDATITVSREALAGGGAGSATITTITRSSGGGGGTGGSVLVARPSGSGTASAASVVITSPSLPSLTLADHGTASQAAPATPLEHLPPIDAMVTFADGAVVDAIRAWDYVPRPELPRAADSKVEGGSVVVALAAPAGEAHPATRTASASASAPGGAPLSPAHAGASHAAVVAGGSFRVMATPLLPPSLRASRLPSGGGSAAASAPALHAVVGGGTTTPLRRAEVELATPVDGAPALTTVAVQAAAVPLGAPLPRGVGVSLSRPQLGAAPLPASSQPPIPATAVAAAAPSAPPPARAVVPNGAAAAVVPGDATAAKASSAAPSRQGGGENGVVAATSEGPRGSARGGDAGDGYPPMAVTPPPPPMTTQADQPVAVGSSDGVASARPLPRLQLTAAMPAATAPRRALSARSPRRGGTAAFAPSSARSPPPAEAATAVVVASVADESGLPTYRRSTSTSRARAHAIATTIAAVGEARGDGMSPTGVDGLRLREAAPDASAAGTSGPATARSLSRSRVGGSATARSATGSRGGGVASATPTLAPSQPASAFSPEHFALLPTAAAATQQHAHDGLVPTARTAATGTSVGERGSGRGSGRGLSAPRSRPRRGSALSVDSAIRHADGSSSARDYRNAMRGTVAGAGGTAIAANVKWLASLRSPGGAAAPAEPHAATTTASGTSGWVSPAAPAHSRPLSAGRRRTASPPAVAVTRHGSDDVRAVSRVASPSPAPHSSDLSSSLVHVTDTAADLPAASRRTVVGGSCDGSGAVAAASPPRHRRRGAPGAATPERSTAVLGASSLDATMRSAGGSVPARFPTPMLATPAAPAASPAAPTATTMVTLLAGGGVLISPGAPAPAPLAARRISARSPHRLAVGIGGPAPSSVAIAPPPVTSAASALYALPRGEAPLAAGSLRLEGGTLADATVRSGSGRVLLLPRDAGRVLPAASARPTAAAAGWAATSPPMSGGALPRFSAASTVPAMTSTGMVAEAAAQAAHDAAVAARSAATALMEAATHGWSVARWSPAAPPPMAISSAAAGAAPNRGVMSGSGRPLGLGRPGSAMVSPSKPRRLAEFAGDAADVRGAGAGAGASTLITVVVPATLGDEAVTAPALPTLNEVWAASASAAALARQRGMARV